MGFSFVTNLLDKPISSYCWLCPIIHPLNSHYGWLAFPYLCWFNPLFLMKSPDMFHHMSNHMSNHHTYKQLKNDCSLVKSLDLMLDSHVPTQLSWRNHGPSPRLLYYVHHGARSGAGLPRWSAESLSFSVRFDHQTPPLQLKIVFTCYWTHGVRVATLVYRYVTCKLCRISGHIKRREYLGRTDLVIMWMITIQRSCWQPFATTSTLD